MCTIWYFPVWDPSLQTGRPLNEYTYVTKAVDERKMYSSFRALLRWGAGTTPDRKSKAVKGWLGRRSWKLLLVSEAKVCDRRADRCGHIWGDQISKDQSWWYHWVSSTASSSDVTVCIYDSSNPAWAHRPPGPGAEQECVGWAQPTVVGWRVRVLIRGATCCCQPSQFKRSQKLGLC